MEALHNVDDSQVISRHMKIILFLSCIVSGLISIWSYYADPIINNDGIDYVRAAAALVEGDFDKAKEHYKWLFYPALMAVTHSIFGVSYYIAAVIINALSNIIAVSFFILLLRLFKANTTALIIGAVVIVSFPGLNEMRSYLVRDHGYIAFYLMALYFFCQYWLKNSSIKAASNSSQMMINRYYFYSVFAAVIAFLFRIEGMIFALIILISPLIINFKQHRCFRPFAILAMSMLVIMVVSVYSIWLYTPIEGANYSKLSLGAVTTGWQQLMDNLSLQIERLEIDIIKTSSGDIGRFMYVWIAFGLVISHVLSLLTLMYSVFLIYGWRKKVSFPNQSLVPAWFVFILANLAILLFFSLTQLFLTDRYPLAMAVTWMLFVVFVLAFAWNRWRQEILVTTKKRVRYIGYFVLLLLTVNAFQGLTSVTKKKALPEVAQIINDMMVPDESIYRRDNVLFTNSKLFAHYSGINPEKIRVYDNEKRMWQFFYLGKWVDFQYVILDIVPTAKRDQHFKTAFWANPTYVYESENGREIRFYDIQKYREERKAGKIR